MHQTLSRQSFTLNTTKWWKTTSTLWQTAIISLDEKVRLVTGGCHVEADRRPRCETESLTL